MNPSRIAVDFKIDRSAGMVSLKVREGLTLPATVRIPINVWLMLTGNLLRELFGPPSSPQVLPVDLAPPSGK